MPLARVRFTRALTRPQGKGIFATVLASRQGARMGGSSTMRGHPPIFKKSR